MSKKDIFGDEMSKPETDFQTLFENSMGKISSKLKVGDKISCEVLTQGKEEFFVSTGTLLDGVVLSKDYANEPIPKTGDVVQLYVTQVRNDSVRLSPLPTSKNLSEDLEDAFDMMQPVEGKVTEVCNGGFRVQLLGKMAFCPISQMDSKRIEKGDEYVGRKFQFYITKFEGGKNIVVSRRKLLDEEKSANQALFVDEVKIGQILSGQVTRLENFGAFIEVRPGVEGLVHISEIKWSRLSHPSEALQVGNQVQAKVIKIEDMDGKLKLSLSIKQAEPEPWDQLPSNIHVGSTMKLKVTRKENFGLFFSLVPGITGLLPKNKTRTVADFQFDKVKVGDELVVTIDIINSADKKIELGLPKDPDAESWVQFSSQVQSKNMGTLGDQFKNLFNKK